VAEGTGRLFVVGQHVLMFNTQDGRLLRETIEGGHPTQLVVTEGASRVFVFAWTESVGVVYVLDAANGDILRRTDYVSGDLIQDERAGVVLLLAPVNWKQRWGGSVFDAKEGTRLRRLPQLGYIPATVPGNTFSSHPIAVDERTGSVYLYAAFGPAKRDGAGIIELDPKRGKIMRKIRLSTPPVTLALAKQARRLFVLDYGDGTAAFNDAGAVTMFRVDR
jgi:DNA-binding beta-propeller fold protein YncE